MSKTLVQSVSRQRMPNLLAAMAVRPERIVHVCTPATNCKLPSFYIDTETGRFLVGRTGSGVQGVLPDGNLDIAQVSRRPKVHTKTSIRHQSALAVSLRIRFSPCMFRRRAGSVVG